MERLLIRIADSIRATSETLFDPKLLVTVVIFFWVGLIVQVLALSPRQKTKDYVFPREGHSDIVV